MSADEFYNDPVYGKSLREARNAHNDAVVQGQQFRDASSAVEMFLTANPMYAKTNDNRDALLNWLESHNRSLTIGNLQEAFDDLCSKGKLALDPDRDARYGATRD